MDIEQFIEGEHKYISYVVYARDSASDFVIRDCTWKLYKEGELLTEGQGEIKNHTIHILLGPLTAYKYYMLEISYLIANQKLKSLTKIEVISP